MSKSNKKNNNTFTTVATAETIDPMLPSRLTGDKEAAETFGMQAVSTQESIATVQLTADFRAQAGARQWRATLTDLRDARNLEMRDLTLEKQTKMKQMQDEISKILKDASSKAKDHYDTAQVRAVLAMTTVKDGTEFAANLRVQRISAGQRRGPTVYSETGITPGAVREATKHHHKWVITADVNFGTVSFKPYHMPFSYAKDLAKFMKLAVEVENADKRIQDLSAEIVEFERQLTPAAIEEYRESLKLNLINQGITKLTGDDKAVKRMEDAMSEYTLGNLEALSKRRFGDNRLVGKETVVKVK